jgi:hypothetical protein
MGDRREHPPFPGIHQIVWQSSLRGMERPVRSFKSFIRTAPPHPGLNNEKPLPPVPAPREEPDRTAIPPSPVRSFSASPWKAPAAWDEPESPDQEIRTPSFSVTRGYTLLLPEPSPGLCDGEELAWPIKSNSARQSLLACISEQDDHMPPPSPFDAASLHTPVSETEQGKQELDILAMQPATTGSSSAQPENTSGTGRTQKAFASLGIESDEVLRTADVQWSAQPEDSDVRGPILVLRGKKLQQLPPEGPTLQEMTVGVDMDEKLHELSVSQEYHNVLADQYHEDHADALYSLYDRSENKEPSGGAIGAKPKSQSEAHKLMPGPLSWRKDSTGSSAGAFQPELSENANTPKNSRKRYRKVPDWVPFHQHARVKRRLGLDDEHSESAIRSATPVHKELHLSSLIPHMKGLRTNLHRTRIADGSTMGRISSSIPYRPDSSFVSPPVEQHAPLFRLPGGLALIRRSPTPTQTSREAGPLNISLPFNVTRSTANTRSPEPDIEPVEVRPSSLYSQESDDPVVPRVVPKKQRSSSNFSRSLHSRLNNISPSTSPLTHELSFPRTPPPIPRIPQYVPSHPSAPPESMATFDDERADSATEDDSHKRGLHILDRAKGARQAWKRQHKDAKHKKLKNSIRVIGPTDPTAGDGYAKGQGASPDEDGMHGNRVPGYMGSAGGFI